jgi:hypothetical protein
MGSGKLSRAAVPLSVLLCFGAVSLAQPGSSWEYLGDAHVDGSQDHDQIKVTGAKGEFKAIRLSVANVTIEFDRVVVHFSDGNAVPIGIHSKIRPGAETRPIDLPGRQRIIESVEVWYKRGTPANSVKPHVLLYGRS